MPSSSEAQEEAQEFARQQERAALKDATNIYLLRFVPGALPELLAVENSPQAIQSLLGTTKVRVFATGSPATLGLSAALSTQENSARGADEQGECTLLHPTGAFVVVVGAFEGAQASPSAPRNQGLDWAPLAPWVPLCPGALDVAVTTDWERLSLGALSPLQVEFALATFAPRLSHGAVEDVVAHHLGEFRDVSDGAPCTRENLIEFHGLLGVIFPLREIVVRDLRLRGEGDVSSNGAPMFNTARRACS